MSNCLLHLHRDIDIVVEDIVVEDIVDEFSRRHPRSLVPRPFEEEEKGPGTQCLRMRHVFRKTHRKITRKFTAYTWIKILTSEAE